jgi:hypothetical protein
MRGLIKEKRRKREPGVSAARIGRAPLLFLLAVGGFTSCSQIAVGVSVCFAPDSALVAYVCDDQWNLPLPPEMPTIRSKVSVRWSRLDRPDRYQVADIGVFGRNWGGYPVADRIHSVFSPDNRYLAVACPRQLHLLDCQTKAHRILTGPSEVVTSLLWMSADQLAYASCTLNSGGQSGTTSTRLWLQRVDQSYVDRELIFSQQGSQNCPEKGLNVAEWPREHWSPDRRFVVFRAGGFQGALMLLNVEERTASVIAPGSHKFDGISWKSDGSAAACVGFSRTGPVLAFVIDPRTGEKFDFSDEFTRAFGDDSKYATPPMFRLWTPDDQYLIVNSPSKGGCLAKPRPWELVRVAELFVDRLIKKEPRVSEGDSSDRLPWADWLPVKGWVKMWIRDPGTGYNRGMDYFVNYSNLSFVPFGVSSAPGAGWRVTPNGKHAVKLESRCKLIVRELTLAPPGAQ